MKFKIPIDYSDKRVSVLGLGRSGIGAANLLTQLGANVFAMDEKELSQLNGIVNKINKSVKLVTGGFDSDILETSDTVVISPGVPGDVKELKGLKNKRVRIIGEFELAYEAIESCKKNGACRFLSVTGTNGKSTTTSLLNAILNKSGYKTLLGGNIGTALSGGAMDVLEIFINNNVTSLPDHIVTEVSSFQLDSIESFKPKVSAILNIAPDHLDRYESMDAYIKSKTRLFENQDSMDFLVLNADDPYKDTIESRLPDNGPEVFYFSRQKRVKGIFAKDDKIFFNLPEHEILFKEHISEHSALCLIDDIKIKGVHNVENVMAASLMAFLSGAPLEAIRNCVMEFPGLPHRMEFVASIDGISYYNDSKATNVASVLKSLLGFDSQIVLIAGGKDKGEDFSALREIVKEKVKSCVLIGQTGGKLKTLLDGVTEIYMEKDMERAVLKATQCADGKGVVLLSPACASFDMFNDFEHRGNTFKNIVKNLHEK